MMLIDIALCLLWIAIAAELIGFIGCMVTNFKPVWQKVLLSAFVIAILGAVLAFSGLAYEGYKLYETLKANQTAVDNK